MLLKITALLILVSGCISPAKWRPEQHFDAMQHCKSMCGDNQVRKYTPFSAECQCKQ